MIILCINRRYLKREILVCQKDHLKLFPQTLSMAGLIAGNISFNHFGGHYGRKPAFYLGMVPYAVSCFAATTTSNFAIFNTSRFLSSVSKIGIQASIVIFTETIKPVSEKRAIDEMFEGSMKCRPVFENTA